MGSGATCLAQGGLHLGFILEQRFGHDLALGERSQRILAISLYIILLRIFLDVSGLRIEVHLGQRLLPSWTDVLGEGAMTPQLALQPSLTGILKLLKY